MIGKNRLAFSTLGCPQWDFEKILRTAAGMGYAAVEVRGIGNELETGKLPCFLPENRDKTQELLTAWGVKLCCIGTSCNFHTPELAKAAFYEGKAAIDICNAMKIGAIRVFGDRLPEGENHAAIIRQVAEGIADLCAYAEGTGFVQVLLEIHGEFNTVETLSALLPQLAGHPSFGVIWDIEHSFRAYGRDFQPFYRLIRPYIRHTHIKDCRMEGKTPVALLPGEGEINIAQIVRQLEADGYPGYYSFEWEKRWMPEIPEPETAFPAYAALMRSI